jgi:hypothetical protein
MGEGEQFTGTAILSATIQLLTGSTLLENNRRRGTIHWDRFTVPYNKLLTESTLLEISGRKGTIHCDRFTVR